MNEYKREIQNCMTEMSKRMPVGSRMLYASLLDYLRRKVNPTACLVISLLGLFGGGHDEGVGGDASKDGDSV